MKRVLMISGMVIVAASYGVMLWGETKIIRTPLVAQPQRRTQDQSDELINLDTQDIFTAKTFSALMQEKHATGLPYIVARIVSQGFAGDRVRYCNAHDLNKLFGGYPFKSETPFYSQKKVHAGFPVQRVEYFIINNPDDEAFLYLCSLHDLMSDSSYKKTLQDVFYANQTENTRLHIKAQARLAVEEQFDPVLYLKANLSLGEIYYEGRYGLGKDYNRASECLEYVIGHDWVQQDQLIRAHGILGQIYYSGEYGVAKDYSKACRSFEWLLAEQTDPAIRATMMFQLGQLYYAGGYSLAIDYQKARSFFEQAALQEDNATVAIHAFYKLGQIYAQGQGVEKDFDRANIFFNAVVLQSYSPDTCIDAMLGLGEIYCVGGYGVSKDCQRARGYFEQVLTAPNSDEVSSKKAKEWLSELDKISSSK